MRSKEAAAEFSEISASATSETLPPRPTSLPVITSIWLDEYNTRLDEGWKCGRCDHINKGLSATKIRAHMANVKFRHVSV